jgi:hypothetical protein
MDEKSSIMLVSIKYRFPGIPTPEHLPDGFYSYVEIPRIPS